MNSQFYGYTVRSTVQGDMALSASWTDAGPNFTERARFWLRQDDGRETFLVLEGEEALGFFQTQHVGEGDQVRLLFQASPVASPKKVLRAITRLVPLIEQGLSLRGARAIFFTSLSQAMVVFMADRLGYRYAGDGGRDGVMMAKGLTGEWTLQHATPTPARADELLSAGDAGVEDDLRRAARLAETNGSGL